MSLYLSCGPGEGIVSPVTGVGGVDDRLLRGVMDMTMFRLAVKGRQGQASIG